MQYLDKVVIDICSLIIPVSQASYKYIIFFLDAATRYLESKLLKLKLEAIIAFRQYKTKAEN